MSAGGDSGPGRREVAYRLFAAEFDDASLSYSESDEERAPNFVVTPTGLRVNRLFAIGVLTEVESINEDTLRGRIVDPTGAFVTYAGQYQPPAQAFLDQTTPPAFVAITGKARTFEPEDSDRVFTSVRPESLSEVDADSRDRWVVSAAEATLHRIAVCAAALDSPLRGQQLQTALSEAGVGDSLAVGIPRALDHYGTTTAYLDALRQVAVDALELIAGDREEVRALDLAPNEGGETTLGALPSVDIEISVAPASEPATESKPTTDAEPDAESEPTAEPDSEPVSEPASTDTEPETPPTSESEAVDRSPETAEATPESAEATPESAEATPDSVDTTPESTETEVDTVADAEPDTEAVNGASDPDADAEPATAAGAETTEAAEAAEETGMYQLDEAEREQLESEFDTGFSSGNEVDPAGEADIDVPDADELAEAAEAAESAGQPTTADSETTTTEDGLGEFDDGVGEFDDGVGEFDAGDDTSESEPADDESTGETDAEPAAESEPSTDTTDATPDADTTDSTPDADTTDSTPDADTTDDSPPEDLDLEETVVETMAEMDDGDGVDREALVTELVGSYGVDETAIEEAIADALMGGRCYEPGDGVLKAI